MESDIAIVLLIVMVDRIFPRTERPAREARHQRWRVHGGKPNESAVAEQANNALTHTRDALRALFRDRPDVLALPGGAARSLRLIMGG